MIKFLDLKKINAPYESAFQDKLKQVLDNGWYILGSELQDFERDFALYCGTKFCIGVGNGFDALLLLFKGYIQLGKLKKGDAVIVPANTYIASILAILQADLVPVLVEPKLSTFNIDTNAILKHITSNTKAILVVHLYGQLADMDAIFALANAHDLIVLEDAAQAHGAQITSGKASLELQEEPLSRNQAYSFYPSKNLGAVGDGGAITTNDAALAEVLQSIRNYGSKLKYKNDFIGVNSRLDEVQAAFLNVKLPFLDAANAHRIAVAQRYLNEIKNEKIILPSISNSIGHETSHVFHLFVIRTLDRDDLQRYLSENDIETVVHYPIPPHKQKAFEFLNQYSFPITEKIHNEVLSIPMSPVLTEDEVSYVITILNQY
ncbi:DegT/DnrJ/EryC1/StrS aminotransferase family protein [Flavobacterium sp. FPG59]|jgi:dTDP-4-amino-4,6-dideoxygalactose transaminase|uniref:DegT/DnrJ/EryC1/StrS family aminotransferase n=1 Tax=Flavobacterium sp. FPG59 TaxID=1929267 RepID=UPI000A39350A|nr:DegT/DnrJ/EryC1/StrS family aminotransferase [Flavobacterium sp. FPG59]OUD36604.1 aminotransferase [Flavobacterium sp. FPG59]